MGFSLSRCFRHAAGFGLALALGIPTLSAWSAALPRPLDASDLKDIAELVVMPSGHRAWTAHSLESDGDLGIDLGLDASFTPRRDLLDYGAEGVAPRIIPVPRFWIAFDLPWEMKLSGSYAPGSLYDGVGGMGLAHQWSFWDDGDNRVHLSSLFSYSYNTVFGDLIGHTFGLAAQVTKDLEVWQPYAGAGFKMANVKADDRVLASGTKNDFYTTAATHFFLGFRLDLVAKLSFQVDLTAFKPSAAILLETSL